jgi:dihydrofolate reductase
LQRPDVQLSIVVAVADNGIIGRNGALPWHLPDDLKHFKALTMGKPIVMGRRTHESIGRALPGRRNLVVSRGAARGATAGDAGAEDPVTGLVEWVASLEAAIERCAEAPEVCVIGGAGLYASALPLAHTIYLTRVHARPAGDVHFPELAAAQWREIARIEHAADQRHAYAMSFVTLQRSTGIHPVS